jgi:putative resolvase
MEPQQPQHTSPVQLQDYVHIREARKMLGVTTQTLHNWDKKGQIRTMRLPSGARMVHRQDIHDILNGRSTPSPPPQTEEKQKILYYRVTPKTDPTLQKTQMQVIQEKYPGHLLITDTGSGLNWKRKGIQTILDSAFAGTVEEVAIMYQDHICRFAFDLFESILLRLGVRLVILDADQPRNVEQELTDDILTVLQAYSKKTGYFGANNNSPTVIQQPPV